MSDQLLHAIETIYECIGDDFDHDRALKIYSETTDDTGMMISDIRPILGGFRNWHVCNIPDEAVAALVSKHNSAESNPLFRDIALLPNHTPVLRRVYMPDEVFRKTAQYRNTFAPWGLHSDGVALFKKGLIKVTLCGFCRRPDQPEITPELLGLMAILNNHYIRAMNLQSRLDRLEQALIQSSNMLDLINFGVVLYDRSGNPVFANCAAQRIFDDKDGLVLDKTGVKALNLEANQTLQNLMAAVYHPKMPLSAKSGGIVKIPRKSRGRPYSAMLVPLCAKKVSGADEAAVAIFLFDPNLRKTSAIDLFVSSYELSRSEAVLAHHLAMGGSLEEAAEMRGVSRNTVKSQLHSIFAKTNTNRQAELVSLLLHSVAGLNLSTG